MLDDLSDVRLIVDLLKLSILFGVLQLEVVQQLEPQIFKLVRIVLEKFEVVPDC